MKHYLLILLFVPIFLLAQNEKGGVTPVEETILGFSKTLDLEFEPALARVKSELQKEGFGVLTEVDVKAVMKKKLDMDYKPYQILGVCNPPLAHQSLQAEEMIGLMLPCKFIVYVNKENKTVVAAVDPAKMMSGLENEKLTEVAQKVQAKFRKVMELL